MQCSNLTLFSLLAPKRLVYPQLLGLNSFASLHTSLIAFTQNKVSDMLKFCYLRGMPKAPPTSIYKLYLARQLKLLVLDTFFNGSTRYTTENTLSNCLEDSREVTWQREMKAATIDWSAVKSSRLPRLGPRDSSGAGEDGTQMIPMNGVKLAEAAKLWKTQVTEAEKQALAVDLKEVEATFKKQLMAWAESNNLTASESPKELAQAYCEANGIFPNPGSNFMVNPEYPLSSSFQTTELLSSSRPSLDDTSTQDPLRLWLGGLPPKTTEYAVLQLTRQFGQLADFYFPVHKFGDARGSTVGYCFITYKSLEDAEKALKGLDGLNFHGYTLVARQAHPTRDELTMIQLANKEAMGLWIAEQAKLREAELAARLAQVPDQTSGTQDPSVDTIKPAPTITPTLLVPISFAHSNFHGHTLVARQAHPTRDELTMIQLANKEAMGLWIAEQAKLREAELAARLAQVPDQTSGTQDPSVDTIKPAPTITPTFSPLISNTDVATGTSNATSFRPIGSTSPSVMLGTSGCKATTSSGADKRAQIRKIELALRQLENAPIGGVALLRPSSATQRSLIPPGILASRSTETSLHSRMGSGLKRTCSGLSTFGSRSGSNWGQRRQRQRRF
ncbi:hypothetical protein T265_10207 [Opisthorchis viverrini]|uniref:RRM domain-containing protein n=1 Tax=Opisthorchis viverrini TaxID=6198 RepID=A0A074Z7B5_OPIVI|nr:hypothetical protein T265_10207 [Opisthorchis viverrini]KER21472.1 hypothetical protein T265_10207 [Opisthorchis viverrini]